jgi:hypothetical protein
LPLSTAYSVCEGLGFEAGVNRRIREAPVFYFLYTALIVVGGGVILIPGFPLVRMILLSQVLNGVLLPFVLIFMILLINKRDLMGEWVNPRWFNTWSWVTVVVMIAVFLENLYRAVDRQSLHGVSTARDCDRAQQRIVNGFFGSFDHGQEERGHLIVTQQFRRVSLGSEGDTVIAAAVCARRAGARQSEHGSSGHAAQISRVHRRIGGNNHHDGTIPRIGSAPGEFPPHGSAVHHQRPAKIRLHQHAHGIAASDARRRSNSTFKAKRDRSGAGPDSAFLHRTAVRRLQGRQHFSASNVTAANVVEVSIVGLTHQRIDGSHVFVSG